MAQVTGSVSSAGDNTILAAPGAGLRIVVTGWSLTGTGGTNTVYWKDGAGVIYSAPHVVGATAKQHLDGGSGTGPAAQASSQNAGIAKSPNASLVLNLLNATAVSYTVNYYLRGTTRSGVEEYP